MPILMPATSGVINIPSLDKKSCDFQRSTLQLARSSGTANARDLSEHLFGGSENIQTYLRISKLVENNPAFSREKRYHYGRAECLLSGLHISKAMVDFHRKHRPSMLEAMLLRYFVDEAVPITLHFEMFLPVLKAQGTDEQYARWGKAAEDFGIIGCYAQTEIGHGSNLSNLETTATFMRTSGGGQFILNSPSLSSIKWWIGGLGVISTHALVQAKLIIDSVDYGPHLFIVQIRSLVDHSPLPNVEVGDIGAKFGMAKNDNGWLRFNQAKICRSQLLSRFASVDENGNYNPPVHPKIFYGGMVIIRVQLVEQAWLYLARAVTITSRFFCLLTSRYTTVRRQFLSKSGGDENPVITYPLVKYRLFPLIASCFVFNCVGARTASLFDQMTEQLKSYNADLLPFVHALSSGLKSYFTSYVANAVEESRKICGGHGFSKYSGFFHLYTEYVASNTYEGDNALLTQQLARFLLKSAKSETSPLKWLNERTLSLESSRQLARDSFCDPAKDHLLAAFRHRCKRLVTELASAVKTFGFDSQNVLCFRVSVAFCQYFCIESMLVAPRKNTISAVLDLMRDVYAISILDSFAADWLEDASLDGKILKKYRHHLEADLFKRMAPEVISLTDSFLLPDFMLDSAIGSSDGDAYRHLLASALRDPVNVDINSNSSAYLQFIRPILKESASKL